MTHTKGTEARLEAIVLATSTLISELAPEGVLQKAVEVAAEVIGARYAAIGVLEPDGRLLESFTTYGVTAEERARIGAPPRGHGILGLVIREPRPIRLPDLGKHPDSYGFPPHHPPMRSFLGVPIVGRRGVFGNFYLTEKLGADTFSDEDEHIAILLAAMVAAVVENARLHEESARLIEEVQELHRTREHFFAMVNHELRNALAAASGWAQMLVRKKDPATIPRAAFEVLDSTQQAVGLINDLLDLSRLDEDRLKPVIRSVEPGAIARRAIGRVTPAAEFKKVSVELQVLPGLPSCETDASRVEQILMNLMGNAIHHTPESGTVSVEVGARDGLVHFSVRDEGPGVEDADLERIFDIYMTKSTGDSRGSGLGLPLSRRLARLLGGELLALPSAQGGGGRFILQLPAATDS